MRVVEIRSYRLQPGSSARFHALVMQQSLPLMEAAGIDVLAFGPSLLGDEGYYLIRAFADLADLQASQDAFYASTAWRTGPRQAIIELIESDSNVVLAMSEAAIDGLRRIQAAV
ncbi:NIPSNAP family protein [Paucibacter sp. AS339]|uniref:NIPSNAP family protein n=1 Tax=Paucibacter hankyongi TaxID=3133434 RepID=UPI00309C911D